MLNGRYHISYIQKWFSVSDMKEIQNDYLISQSRLERIGFFSGPISEGIMLV
jgi:hypothetical protein